MNLLRAVCEAILEALDEVDAARDRDALRRQEVADCDAALHDANERLEKVRAERDALKAQLTPKETAP